MNEKYKNFIQDRKTPYSEIQNIVENEDGTISYTEKYDLKHPMCPIIGIEWINENEKVISFSEVKKLTKPYFELLYGSIEEKEQCN